MLQQQQGTMQNDTYVLWRIIIMWLYCNNIQGFKETQVGVKASATPVPNVTLLQQQQGA